MRSENKNFLFNVIYQILTYIFPLITIPYISRVLGVENVGIYSYTHSVVYIFMLLGMLGINNYGNREIAKVRDDKEKTSQCFSSIYYLQLIINFTALLLYCIYIYKFCSSYVIIARLQAIYLISIIFDVTWFFFGLEKFKLTITRNLLIKIISLCLIFLLVKKKDDLWIYTCIISFATIFSQLYLFFNLRRYIVFKRVKIEDILCHTKKVFLLFIPVLAYSIYRVMDKIMIGSMASVSELGYYENAERLINIPISIISAFGTVMLPRMSYLLANKAADFKKTLLESMQLVMILSTIMSFSLFLISNEISIFMFGRAFEKSGLIVKGICVTIIISAWANVIRTQYIIPKGLDTIYVKSTIGGAILNLIANLIFIKVYGALGACIGTVLAEFYVMFYQTIKCREFLEIRKYLNLLFKYSVQSLFIIFIAYLSTLDIDSKLLRLIIRVTIILVLFVIMERKYILYNFIGRKK